eukprot:7115026-Pyramimonas_sp.AAC.1
MFTQSTVINKSATNPGPQDEARQSGRRPRQPPQAQRGDRQGAAPVEDLAGQAASRPARANALSTTTETSKTRRRTYYTILGCRVTLASFKTGHSKNECALISNANIKSLRAAANSHGGRAPRSTALQRNVKPQRGATATLSNLAPACTYSRP